MTSTQVRQSGHALLTLLGNVILAYDAHALILQRFGFSLAPDDLAKTRGKVEAAQGVVQGQLEGGTDQTLQRVVESGWIELVGLMEPCRRQIYQSMTAVIARERHAFDDDPLHWLPIVVIEEIDRLLAP